MARDEASDSECLRMAVFSVNTAMSPEGLVPMLLVLGALLRPSMKTPSPNQLKRRAVIEEERTLLLQKRLCEEFFRTQVSVESQFGGGIEGATRLASRFQIRGIAH